MRVVDTGKQRQVELSFRSIGATGEYLSGEMSLTNMLAELDELMPDLVLRSSARSEIVALLERIRTEHADSMPAKISEQDQVVGRLVKEARDLLRQHLRELDRNT